MNASKPTIAVVALAAVLIAVCVLKSPPDDLPEEKDRPSNTLSRQVTLKSSSETDRQLANRMSGSLAIATGLTES